MNQIDLNERVAVITGGSGGIGFAAADRMTRSGATVILWDNDQAALDNAQEKLPNMAGCRVDVTDEAAVERVTQQAISRFGRIDILVSVAGINARRTPVVEYSTELWRRVIDVNLTGTFLCCRAVVRHMQRTNYGRIVNIASVAGKEGNPFNSAYSAAKAGVIAFTKSLAKEIATTEIRVNCVTPAIVATKNLYYDMPEEDRHIWVDTHGLTPVALAAEDDYVSLRVYAPSDSRERSAFTHGLTPVVLSGALIELRPATVKVSRRRRPCPQVWSLTRQWSSGKNTPQPNPSAPRN